MEINLNKKLNKLIEDIDLNNKPNLFLHSCCAPCSSAVFEKLYTFFNIFVIYHNPNIDTFEEFKKRLAELKKLIKINNYKIKILYDNYDHNEFLTAVNGYEKEPEGMKRCPICYELRLKKTYDITYEYINNNNLSNKINYLCSTLSISPHKDALKLYEIGEKLCSKNQNILKYLPNDFKKENGYLKSIELSKKYGLYRQDYCGCEFAKNSLF